jgi:hypothetical protein
MRVRCTATADYRGNAVGELELECKSDGLCIGLRGVSSYREGYAPGPPVHADDFCVPWPGVYATRLGERQLQLSIDARSFASGAGTPARYQWLRYWAIRSWFWTQMEEQPYFLVT